MNISEQIERIDRAIAETQRLQRETQEFVAETHKLTMDTTLAPLSIGVVLLAAGGGLVGGTVALMRLLG